MLSDLLKSRQCFKLVCGAGNEDVIEVEKLVALYSKAGARYFDLSARADVVDAARRGLERVIPAAERANYFLNVSVGIKGDPHVSKARIDEEKCIACNRCMEVCIHRAVLLNEGRYSVNTVRCIGCGACIPECSAEAITAYSQNKPLEEVLPPLTKLGIHSIELHAVTDDEEGAVEQWRTIESTFRGPLSLCIDRSRVGDVQLIRRIKRMIANRADFSTVIQADGAPMSGCDDKYETTLQALATAQIVERANLPVFLMLSGGTNSTTAELAKMFGIRAHGVALGSYARMIVRAHIERTDFLDNPKVFDTALEIAKGLVDRTLKYMG
jgi:ferredoxin